MKFLQKDAQIELKVTFGCFYASLDTFGFYFSKTAGCVSPKKTKRNRQTQGVKANSVPK